MVKTVIGFTHIYKFVLYIYVYIYKTWRLVNGTKGKRSHNFITVIVSFCLPMQKAYKQLYDTQKMLARHSWLTIALLKGTTEMSEHVANTSTFHLNKYALARGYTNCAV